MNITSVFYKFPDQEACIAYLEEIRWGDDAHCPHCGSTSVARKDDQGRIGRWNCHGCKSSFNVLAGTIFENTKDTPSKVVSGHCSDYQCQKKPVKLSACPRSGHESKISMVHAATHPCPNGWQAGGNPVAGHCWMLTKPMLVASHASAINLAITTTCPPPPA